MIVGSQWFWSRRAFWMYFILWVFSPHAHSISPFSNGAEYTSTSTLNMLVCIYYAQTINSSSSVSRTVNCATFIADSCWQRYDIETCKFQWYRRSFFDYFFATYICHITKKLFSNTCDRLNDLNYIIFMQHMPSCTEVADSVADVSPLAQRWIISVPYIKINVHIIYYTALKTCYYHHTLRPECIFESFNWNRILTCKLY